MMWVAATLGLATATLLGVAYLYQDEITSRLVRSLNQYITTPVQVQQIQVSAWRDFPRIAVSFDQVFIPGSLDTTKVALARELPLATVDRVDFSFNLLSLLQGTYQVQQMTLSEGTINLLLDKDQAPNYLVFRKKSADDHSESADTLTFQLDQINLRNVKVRYYDVARQQDVLANAHELSASLNAVGQEYNIAVSGDIVSEYIDIESDRYFAQQPLTVDTRLLYDNHRQHLSIASAQVGLEETQVSIEGTVDHSEETTLDLKVETTQATLTTLLSVLPTAMSQPWKHYRSAGNVYLTGQVQGVADQPLVQLTFEGQNASFFHPDYQQKLENIQLNGSFTNGIRRSAQTAELHLKNIDATLNGKRLSGNLLLRNFRDLYLETAFRGEFSVESLLAFYPIPQLRWAKGEVAADVQLKGAIRDLQSSQLNQRRKTQSRGTLDLTDCSFELTDNHLPFQQISGKFQVQDNHVTIRKFSGYVGHSHFSWQGQLRNAIAYVLTKTHPIQIDASLHSDFIDLDELLSGHLSVAVDPGNMARSAAQDWQTVAEKQEYRFEISPRLSLNFDCDIKRLKFRRFRGRSIQSSLSILQQITRVRNLSVQTAGGHAYASALINAQRETIRTQGETRLEGIHADSLFYIFEDFQQDFLTSRHLRGEVYAQSDWQMDLDRSLLVQYPSLTSDTYATIRKGELNNFDPMQRIAPYVDEQQLDHLRFGDIQNHIRIHDQQIHIPTMLVHSNLSDIQISGVHTFGNHIDYRFEVPMRSIHLRSAKARERAARRKKDFGEIAADDAAPTKLFLKAQGTIDEYRISYDLPAAKAQLKKNLAEEKQELKSILKNQRKPANYEIELSDEYLEFDPPPKNQP